MGFTPLQKLFIGPQSLPFYDIHLALYIDIYIIFYLIFYNDLVVMTKGCKRINVVLIVSFVSVIHFQ